MELISTIVNELTDVNISLTSPLIKTKVLASRLQNQELLQWVNNELNGYRKLDSLPSYRKTTGEIYGDYKNGNWQVSNQVIVFPEQDEKTTKELYRIDICLGIQALESFKTDSKGYIGECFSIEQKRILQDYLKKQNPYLELFEIYRRAPNNFVVEILSNVRDKLLDFMLQLENECDHISEIEGLKLYNKQITEIMYTTIIGDGNVLTTGSNNSISSRITINKGNKEALKKQLLQSQIPVKDIEELLKIVDLERPESENVFGSQVTAWISKMINKSLDGTWQIGIGAAGGVLATALQQYYGIH